MVKFALHLAKVTNLTNSTQKVLFLNSRQLATYGGKFCILGWHCTGCILCLARLFNLNLKNKDRSFLNPLFFSLHICTYYMKNLEARTTRLFASLFLSIYFWFFCMVNLELFLIGTSSSPIQFSETLCSRQVQWRIFASPSEACSTGTRPLGSKKSIANSRGWWIILS